MNEEIVNKWIARIFKYKVITPDCPEGKIARPLITRYNLLEFGNFAVYLHKFHRGDVDDFHDHPWAFVTFLFHSGYWEHVPDFQNLEGNSARLWPGDKRIWRSRFSVLYRPAIHRHYVEVVKPTWTLVFRMKTEREWGFIIKGIWHNWRDVESSKSRAICEDIK